MDHVQHMLASQPHQPSALATIGACIIACSDCAATCTLCADACLAEPHIDALAACIRLDLDCADLCSATGRIVARLTKPNRATMKAALNASIAACEACAAECERHAAAHAHCRVCAEACRDCARACRALLAAIP